MKAKMFVGAAAIALLTGCTGMTTEQGAAVGGLGGAGAGFLLGGPVGALVGGAAGAGAGWLATEEGLFLDEGIEASID